MLHGQTFKQVGELALAFGLSSLIGLEREWRQKSAGLRTHTLVGFGAALFVLVSKYGFGDVLVNGVAFDPSRVAAQIVSGIGFLGGGLIFVRADAVRGLTTAATIWMTAAIGMACGAGLALLALFATAGHFVVALVYPRITRALPAANAPRPVSVVYEDGRGVLRDVLGEVTRRGFSVSHLTTHQLERSAIRVMLELRGGGPVLDDVVVALSEIDGVVEVSAGGEPDAA